MSTFKLRNFLVPYNPGSYVLKPENIIINFLWRIIEYLCGVTISRSSINRIKPQFINSITGDVIEIGGFDNFFKSLYKNGKFLNLDLRQGDFIDIVENAENMKSIDDETFSAVICISVLEHTKNPAKIINEMHRILKPGGAVLISLPWIFESHMEPNDYCRFSDSFIYMFDDLFTVESKELTNGYFGTLAHFCQRNFLLRFTVGAIFCLLDISLPDEARWSTEITLILKKI
jgi:SAM-dependent methyltransferase